MFNNLKIKIQRAKKGYSWYDLCDIRFWFSETFVNMLKEFSDRLHGSPDLPFEEINEMPLKWVLEQYEDIIKKLIKDNWFDDMTEEEIRDEYDLNNHFIRWKIVLRYIAYCLEESGDYSSEVNEYHEEYFKQLFGGDIESIKDMFEPIEDENNKTTMYKLKTYDVNKTLEENYENRYKEIEEYKENMKNKAFKLLSKYFYSLWD